MLDPLGNNANYDTSPFTYPIDSGKYTTLVGEFQNSASPYGTFDQGGNVSEWNEAIISGGFRGLRDGSFFYMDVNPASFYRGYGPDTPTPTYEIPSIGFRVASVASVPEPGSIALLLSCAVAFGIWRIRRRKPLVLSPSPSHSH